jgi:hypothetical protein
VYIKKKFYFCSPFKKALVPAGRAQLDRAPDYGSGGDMFFVYVLLSEKTGRRYVGMSGDPE